jgi:uncharacterized Zn-binding protein involved in type VI secretion
MAAKAVYETNLQMIEANLATDTEEFGEAEAEARAEADRDMAQQRMQEALMNAAGAADIHTCSTPQPPHGMGVVIQGSASVLINGLPAARQGDAILEVAGPENRIAMGLPTVLIGG